METTKQKGQNELSSQTDLFRRIADICNTVTITMNAKELLEVSLKKTMELFHARRGSIFILNEEGKELILKIARGMKIREQERMVKRLGEGVVGKVAESKKPLFVEDISQDSRFKDHKPYPGYTTPSFICAPLIIKDKLIGVINIADKESGQRFSKDELQLLDFLTSQIALNYKRAQLYLKFKDIVKESKTLKDELGKSTRVTDSLKQKVVIQERLASIGKLAGGIAHELNNPLDGVLRYINLSLEHLQEDDIVHGYLLEVKHGLNRMVNIVKNLLACSRNAPPTMQKIDINNAVDDAVSSLSSDIFHKNISVEKKLGEGLPRIIDLGIEGIVSNLLRNAIDAVKDGGLIQITTAAKKNALIIGIGDTGHGMPVNTVEKIFEPFYTTKDIEKGCGLGLTIVSEIVKAYNGKIDVATVPKKGTTFTVTIPV